MISRTPLVIFVLFLLLSCSSSAKREMTIRREKPNFLFLFTDDQTNESIHALNNDEIETPHLDKLLQEGVTFTHCFNQGSWSGAICVASRSMLITGQTAFRVPQNRIYLTAFALQGVKTDTITEVPLWPQVLSENGYESFCTGKWHNSTYALLKGFDKGRAVGSGFYESFDQNGSKDPAYGRISADSEWKPWDPSFNGQWNPEVFDIEYDAEGGKKIGDPYIVNQHTSELYADHAIDYLMKDVKISEKPFFMFVSFNAPHDPRQSPREFINRYPITSIKVPENYLDQHPFDQGERETLRDEVLLPFPRTKEAVQLHRSEYYAMITHLDREIGRILEALEKSGKAENTYVIFSSDHGLAVGQHGLMGKQNQYDHSVRMPLIIKGPGLRKGRKVHNKVYLQSMFATTCELASIEIPESVEFNSIKDLLEGSDKGGEEYIVGSYKEYQRMIRSDRYKLILYPQVKKIQLFDLMQDPKEMHNLAGDAQFEKIKRELMKQLLLKQQELGDKLVLDPIEAFRI